jgi:predicted O-methyltransferase YrrM
MIKSYIKYRLNRKSINQIEDDFVKILLLKIIKKDELMIDSELLNLIGDLKSDERLLKITDLGAGSRVNNSPERKIKSIFKSASSKPKQAKFIAKLVNHFEINTVLELGTSLGVSASFLAKSNINSKIYTIEGCPNISNVAKENFNKLNINNVHQFTGEFSTELEKLLVLISKPELVFVDGNHTYEATKKYYDLFLEKATKNAILVFDDIHWSDGMEKAWGEIVNSKRSVLTIDFFDFGLVFLDVSLTRGHYILKY